ncbi:EamA family transporter [Synechococcales cyanobacterium C]|uniref:EamA family transporter n=1 Tax=Petrachloros mirabilis ULC683 TaxID=2781853 RepID=A0A8K2A665_9CYAN|nr:DMT family transporter [Petrachloros mirabilis]NCJ05109.1 EamA family transporter [Petrachloros mirabilis ULC683]
MRLPTATPLNRLLLIAPFFLWGTAMVAMKGVIPQTTPLFMAGLRIIPAGILVVIVAGLWGSRFPQTWAAWGWICLFALVDGTLFQGFLATGLVKTGAGLGSVMIDSQPLAVALLALWLYGERIGIWGWIGLLVGITGISCIGLPDDWIHMLLSGTVSPLALLQETSLSSFLHNGEALMLFAALAMAVGTVMIPRVAKSADPIMATGWHMILGGLPLWLGSGLWESQQWQQLDLSAWLAIGYATVFGSAIAYGLFFYYASLGNVTSLSALTFLTPVFALVFGHWFLAEVLTPIQFGGVCLTLISIYLVNQRGALAAVWADLWQAQWARRQFRGLLGRGKMIEVAIEVMEASSKPRQP